MVEGRDIFMSLMLLALTFVVGVILRLGMVLTFLCWFASLGMTMIIVR